MLGVELMEIDEQFLNLICAEKWSESMSLDFKRDLPGNANKDKNEILKDVCAFANSGGGDLIYGIGEKEGVAEKISAISSESFDLAKRRIGQIIDSGIEPRLNNVQLEHVLVGGGYILIVRVPPQFGGPYRTNLDGITRFYMRNGIYTTELTYQQLRQAFGHASVLYDKAVSFRGQRIAALQENRHLRPLIAGTKSVLHMIPFQGIAGAMRVDLKKIRNNASGMMGSQWGGLGADYNLDGLILSSRGGAELFSYAQIYRNGACEIVQHAEGHQDFIPSRVVAEFYREFLDKVVTLLRAHQFSGPMLVAGALLNVTGKKLGVGGALWEHPTADRDDLVFDEILIENLADFPDIDEVARPIADTMWQSFGLERCQDYDEAGKWKARR